MLALILGLCAPGCSVRGATAGGSQQPLPEAQGQAGLGAILPPPSQLREASDSLGQFKLGRDFEANLPSSHAEVDGDNARFSPEWQTNRGLTGAAYAIYQFGLPDYSGEESLSLTWSKTGNISYAWVALANFSRDRWDWFPMPYKYDKVSRLDCSFADYINPSDGRMLVAPLFTDPSGWTWLLSQVRVGDPPGHPWVHSWGGDLADTAYGAATDTAGNLYLTGFTASYGAGLTDLLLLKYSADGELLWQKTWGTAGHNHGAAITVDGNGEVYIAGETAKPGAQCGLLLLRLSSAGALEWQKFYGLDEWSLTGTSIAVDSLGNVFLLGTITGADIVDGVQIPQYDAVAIKLSPDGAMQWDSVWGGLHSDYLKTILPDEAGGCYLGGWCIGLDATSNGAAAALKFNASGSLDWARSWHYGVGVGAWGMTRAADGTLWFAGAARQSEMLDEQALLLALDPSGAFLSASTLGGSEAEMLNSVACAADGSLHACGATYDSDDPITADAYYVVVTSGGLTVSNTWGHPPGDESFRNCVLGSGNTVFLTGHGEESFTGTWVKHAATYQAGVTGTLVDEGTALKDSHVTLSEISGTLQDVNGIQDSFMADTENVIACKPQ